MKPNRFTPLKILSLRGFTIQELVFVLILVVILARVAIPVYQTVANQSKAASVRATLDEVRAALKAYRMNERLEGRPESWPNVASVRDVNDFGNPCIPGGSCPSNHIFSNCDMPNNPFSDPQASVCEHDYVEGVGSITAKGDLSGSRRGWKYKEASGDFWAQSTQYPGENTW